METLSTFWTVLFWTLAFIFSTFYGLKAVIIFIDPKPANKPVSWKIHQFWINFLGAIVGWISLWLLLPNLINSFCNNDINIFSFGDLLLLIISFVGITGYFPITVVGIALGLNNIVLKLFDAKK